MYDTANEILTLDVDYGDELADMDGARSAGGVSPGEAFIMSLNHRGRIDLPYMSELTCRSAGALIAALDGTVMFQDPACFENGAAVTQEDGWVVRSRYLSGNLHEKYRLAQRMHKKYPAHFAKNISVLRALRPSKLSLEDIHVTLGATWIPRDIYEDFIRNLLQTRRRPGVTYIRELGSWIVSVPEYEKDSVRNNITYGTLDMSAEKIIENTMNARTVKVYDTIRRVNRRDLRVINKAKTYAVLEKQNLILREFSRWATLDFGRRKRLQDCYNEAYTGYIFSKFDGSILELPDMAPDIRLYPHQRNAVARILLSGENVLLAHDVGSGKTYVMACAAHELHRLGLSRKNLMVVPNNVLASAANAHRTLYPGDRLLVIEPERFKGEDKNRLLAEIRDHGGEYAAIYMAYSSFDMVVMSKQYWIGKRQAQIRKLRNAAENAPGRREAAKLKSAADSLAKKLSQYILEAEDTPLLPFEALGIQTLFVDEAHNYKNIKLHSRADNIVGMRGAGSRKCIEMEEKTQVVDRVVFATGTPLTNSLADLFVLQHYLQPHTLRFQGLESMDAWLNTFARRESLVEVDVDAASLRMITRFASFHNLTELMAMFANVCDFHQMDADAAGLPAFHGYQDVVVPRSAVQDACIRYLARRTEDIRHRRTTPAEDNLLKVTADGRKCALDVRLIDLDKAEIPYDGSGASAGKVRACAGQIMKLYSAYPGTCQIVFSDIGTPKSRFNVYDALREELERAGIPAGEIAYAHDAKSESSRERLYRNVNSGKLRVVIGSTAKLGVGVNVQENLIALHHLDAPWRPSDIEQREGRLIRRGNKCREVFIFRYIVPGTFDSYTWQLLESKQRFIASFLSGAAGVRDMRDVADTVLNYAEVKALCIGNPLIRKRVEKANELDRAKIAGRQRQKQLAEYRAVIEDSEERVAHLRALRQAAAADDVYYAAHKASIPREERLAFGEELLEAVRDNVQKPRERLFDTYQGFDVVLPADMTPEEPFVYLRRPDNGSAYRVGMDTDKAMGCAMRLDHALEGLIERTVRLGERILDAQKQAALAQEDMARGNPYQKEIEALELELWEIDRELAMKEAI